MVFGVFLMMIDIFVSPFKILLNYAPGAGTEYHGYATEIGVDSARTTVNSLAGALHSDRIISGIATTIFDDVNCAQYAHRQCNGHCVGCSINT
jgi:hypothetical protein